MLKFLSLLNGYPLSNSTKLTSFPKVMNHEIALCVSFLFSIEKNWKTNIASGNMQHVWR